MAKIKVVFLLMFVFVLGYTEELEVHKSQADSMQTQSAIPKKLENNIYFNKNEGLSIDADISEAEGYSEMELYRGNGTKNELEAALSRYRLGFRLNYSIQPIKIFKLSFFVSNGLEINIERGNGKIKSYDTIQGYEENTYDYGQRLMTYGFINNIGMIMAIAEQHHISLTLKQTYKSSDMLGISMDTKENFVLNNAEISQSFVRNPYWLTTQIFLIYSYVF